MNSITYATFCFRAPQLVLNPQHGADPGVIRFRIKIGNQRNRHIECRGSHYYDEQGVWRSTIGTCRDITEQILTERSLERQNKLASRALEVKSNFIACMSHEIRTPMNGVLGIIDHLSRTKLTQDQLENIEIAKKSGNNVLAIINDILDFSKLENGTIEFESTRFNIVEEVKAEIEELRNLADKKSLELIFDCTTQKHYEVSGDSFRIRQLINILVSNAIKFTKTGSVSVTISCSPKDNLYEIFTFSVSDTGIGIEQEKVSSLFDLFTQADSSSTRRYGGTGIGLAIVKRIVDKLSGKILIDTTLNKGSRFYGELVVGRVTQVLPADKENSLDKIDFSKLNVLLVEDIELNQVVASMLLEEIGIEPIVAENGQIALDKLRLSDERFDFIFMDCEMPVMDGFTATELIRKGEAGEKYCDIPIAALTAHVSEIQKQRAKSSGMNGFISKPVSLESMQDVISKNLNCNSNR